jgi:hypothetical protein
MRLVSEVSKALHQFTREEMSLGVHVISLIELLRQTCQKSLPELPSMLTKAVTLLTSTGEVRGSILN